MAELVEQGLDLVQAEQGRRVVGGGGEVADQVDHGVDLDPRRTVLAAEPAAPGALALALARVVVHVDHRGVRSVGLEDLEDLGVGVRPGHVLERLEGQTVEPVGDVEDAVADVAELEVGPQLVVVEVVLGLAQLLGVVPPVPRCELESAALGVDDGLHLGDLALGHRQRGVPQPVEQRVDVVGRSGHPGLERVVGEGLVAEQLRLLDAERDDLGDHRLVVELVVLVAADRVGGVELPPQIAVVGVGQKRQHARLVGREDPGALVTFAGCRLGRGDHDDRKLRVAPVDLLEPGLLRVGEQGAVAHRALVELLQEEPLLAVEVELVPLLVHLSHPREELGVELDRVAVRGQPRRDVLLDRLQLVVGVRTAEREEDPRYLVEELARPVERGNRVVEGRRFRVVDDGLDLGVLPSHPLLERRDEVPGSDAVERLDVERRAVVREERVGVLRTIGDLAAAGRENDDCENREKSLHGCTPPEAPEW